MLFKNSPQEIKFCSLKHNFVGKVVWILCNTHFTMEKIKIRQFQDFDGYNIEVFAKNPSAGLLPGCILHFACDVSAITDG